MNHVIALLGQAITWSIPQRPTYEPGSWTPIPQPDVVRTGVVWSHGPVENTAWVIPDERAEDEGHAVCVAVSKSGKHTQRDVDLKRSTANVQERGLAAMRIGGTLPISLARGDDGYGAKPYALPRGGGEDPWDSYVVNRHAFGDFLRGKVKARGTCTECGKPRPVRRVETVGRRPITRANRSTGHVTDQHTDGPVLSVGPLVAPHKVKGTTCPGGGWPAQETHCTTGRELAGWIEVYGKEAVA